MDLKVQFWNTFPILYRNLPILPLWEPTTLERVSNNETEQLFIRASNIRTLSMFRANSPINFVFTVVKIEKSILESKNFLHSEQKFYGKEIAWHNLEISWFFYHSDFTWNQFGDSKSAKSAILTHSEALIFYV